MMLKNLKIIEFSKRLLAFIEVLVLLCYILVIVAVVQGDASALVAFIGGVFALASVAFGFYFWKAKNENLRKYAKELTKDQMKELVRLIEVCEDLGGDQGEKGV